MSWLFSQALVAECSAANCLGGIPCVQLKMMNTAAMFLSHGKMMEASNLSRFGMMCELLTESYGTELLTLFLEGFRVRHHQRQHTVETWAKKICFHTSSVYATRYNQCSYGLSVLKNRVYRASKCLLPSWAHHILGADVGPLPTPTATANQFCKSMQKHPACRRIVKLFGKLTPEIFEWMMGWPIGWTDLRPLETDRFQQWQEKHGTSCAKKLGRKNDTIQV
jgi:hypothetical protein